MHLKSVKVNNARNVLVQIPGFVVAKWNLKDDDHIEVHITDDEKEIRLVKQGRTDIPFRGYVNG